MGSIVAVFTEDFNVQADEYINLLFHLAKRSNSTADERIYKVKELTEAYFKKTGWHMDSQKLDRLATLILWDDNKDTDQHKVKHTEYPSFNHRQMIRRKQKEASDVWLDTIGSDKRNYRVPTRYNNRAMREKIDFAD